MTRIFVDPQCVGEHTISICDRDDLHHLLDVLRLREGSTLDISDRCLWEYKCEIETIEKERIEAKILNKQRFSTEPQVQITLFQGIPKSGKMETIIQKCVELGVSEIVPLWTKRTVVTDKGNFGKKLARYNKISAEAVKQCKRGIIPPISKDCKFDEMLQRLKEYDLVLFPYENEENYTIKQCLRSQVKKPNEVAIIIGPEGGFSEEEAAAVQAAGGISVSLCKTILRTETAGPAALAMVMYELEL